MLPARANPFTQEQIEPLLSTKISGSLLSLQISGSLPILPITNIFTEPMLFLPLCLSKLMIFFHFFSVFISCSCWLVVVATLVQSLASTVPYVVVNVAICCGHLVQALASMVPYHVVHLANCCGHIS